MTWWRGMLSPTMEQAAVEKQRDQAQKPFTWLGEHCGRKGHRRYDDTAIDERYADEWGASA